MDTKGVIIQSIKPQNIKCIKCPDCGIKVEYNPLETTQSYKIKCYNCQNQFLPNQESKTESGENKIDKSFVFIKFGNPRNDEKYCKNDNSDIVIEEEFIKQKFGGDHFSDYIGDIIYDTIYAFKESLLNMDILTASNMEEKNMKNEKMKKMVEKRVKELSKKLLEKIESHIDYVKPYFNNNKELKKKEKESISLFKTIISFEAEKLKNESHGIELLYIISYIYKLKSKQALYEYNIKNGFILKKIIGSTIKFTSDIKEFNNDFSILMKQTKSIIELNKNFEKVRNQKMMNIINENIEEEKKKESMDQLRQEAVISWINAFWQSSKYNIEYILAKVCDKVFYDTTVDSIEIKERAMAILAIAETFIESINIKLIQPTDTIDVGDWLMI